LVTKNSSAFCAFVILNFRQKSIKKLAQYMPLNTPLKIL
jgi:hypothetical protein